MVPCNLKFVAGKNRGATVNTLNYEFLVVSSDIPLLSYGLCTLMNLEKKKEI